LAECAGDHLPARVGLRGAVDYLVEKLLSFRLCKMGLARGAGKWVTTGPMPVLKPRGSTGLSAWEKDALEKLMDLAEASRRDFGDTDECSVWSRRRQWQARKASRAGGASDWLGSPVALATSRSSPYPIFVAVVTRRAGPSSCRWNLRSEPAGAVLSSEAS